MKISNLNHSIAVFHNDEDGIEAVQVVMIVAIAAVILIGAMSFGQEVFTWLTEKFNALKDKDIEI